MSQVQIKRYELLPSLNVTAPVFIQTGKKSRVRKDKLPMWAPYLTYTFTDEDGENKTVRLKLSANSIYQDDQIKANIPANAKFTQKERVAPRFHIGYLVTGNKILQQYLESIPPFEGFKGTRDGSEAHKQKYRLVDGAAASRSEKELIIKQTKAATRVLSLDENAASELLISLFGSAHSIPVSLDDMHLELINHINENEGGAEAILRKRDSADDKAKVLIGKAVNLGIVSFTDLKDQVAMKVSGKWKPVKEIPSAFDLAAKESRFVEHLNSKEGAALKADLEKAVATTAKKK